MYGGRDQGVRTAHLDCVSLVVRSRGIGLNACVIKVLGTDFGEECGMNGISHGCHCSCNVVMRDRVESNEVRRGKPADGTVFPHWSVRATEAVTARGSAEQELVSGNSSSSSDEVDNGCDWQGADFEFDGGSSCYDDEVDDGGD